jgi:hypothetical protein
MKLLIRSTLICFVLFSFSSIGFTQKQSKTKAASSAQVKKKKANKNPINKKKVSKKKTKKSSNKKTVSKKYSTKRNNSRILNTNDFAIAQSNSAPVLVNQLTTLQSNTVQLQLKDTTPEKVVTIVSSFKPQLKHVAKIGFMNATALVDTNTVQLSYQVPSQNLSFQYQPIALVPRAIKRDSSILDKQSTQIKIGMGNYFNQLIQAQSTLIDHKNLMHSFNVKNESIQGDHPIQQWKNLKLGYMGGVVINKQQSIQTQLYYNNSNRFRYGLVPDTTKLPLSNFEQKFTEIGANFTFINNSIKVHKIYFQPLMKINYSNLHDQANNLAVDFKSPIHFKFKNSIDFHSDINLSYNQYSLKNKFKEDNYFIQLDPAIFLKIKHFNLNMGIRPTYANNDFNLYPKFEVSKTLKDTNINLNAGWKTSLTNNQLVQVFGQNHWIIAPDALPITTTETKYFKVAIAASKRLNYGFNMALNDYRELPFFNMTRSLNNPLSEGLKFDVIFEKRAIAIELQGDFKYQFSDQLFWKSNFKYIQFSLIRENDQAWGVIPFELNTQLNWNLKPRLSFDANGQFWTGAKTSSNLTNAYQLNNTFVLNAGMQYLLSNHWTFWAKGDNLLNQQYQRWANYPSLGVQFLAGIQYKFSKK